MTKITDFRREFPARYFPMCESAIISEVDNFEDYNFILNFWTTVVIEVVSGDTVDRRSVQITNKYVLRTRDADFALLCRNRFIEFVIDSVIEEEGFKRIVL